jgi:sec-independent protein translocase protein TatA
MNFIVLLFGISGGEVIIVLLFILIFFGADKIPGFARTMGRTIRQIKDATSDIQRDIQNSARDVKDQFHEQSSDFQKSVRQAKDQFEDRPKPENKKDDGKKNQ